MLDLLDWYEGNQDFFKYKNHGNDEKSIENSVELHFLPLTFDVKRFLRKLSLCRRNETIKWQKQTCVS